MYIVPMDMPQYCNKCPFGHLNYNRPFWSDGADSGIDGKRNRTGTHGYTCQLDFHKNGRYTKVMRAKIGENIPKPKWCKLKEG